MEGSHAQNPFVHSRLRSYAGKTEAAIGEEPLERYATL